mmetsp:Transcript_22981/g.82029  ORF Transcript_22981/g.82029 Transcript_22981/m.82029 type:complete len:223 (+) Transcript_22981:139-807(+)
MMIKRAKTAQKYPKGIRVDFRKLGLEALRTYVARYELDVATDASQADLATTVARHFQGIRCDEERIMGRFFEFLDEGVDVGSDVGKPREQVAAKTSDSGENGAWILGHVLSWDPAREKYEVQDEDDASKIHELSKDRVRRLAVDDAHVLDLLKGEEVLAIFPETTSACRIGDSKLERADRLGRGGANGVASGIRGAPGKLMGADSDRGRRTLSPGGPGARAL